MTKYYSLSEIAAVIEGFESCTTPKDDFTHLKHLTVAVFYLYDSNEREATDRMRAGLLRFLNHHGVGEAKFHLTLTVFWIKILRTFVLQLPPKTSLLEMTNLSLEHFSNSRVVLDYYAEKRLFSDEARQGWIAPDLKPIHENSRKEDDARNHTK
ncbi:MAG TPA: hypothetical protein VJM12_09930 [Pyrinomonadaceae bacterium]|nr:hypothetical protein [Pyrinomonadaceae bacterium]